MKKLINVLICSGYVIRRIFFDENMRLLPITAGKGDISSYQTINDGDVYYTLTYDPFDDAVKITKGYSDISQPDSLLTRCRYVVGDTALVWLVSDINEAGFNLADVVLPDNIPLSTLIDKHKLRESFLTVNADFLDSLAYCIKQGVNRNTFTGQVPEISLDVLLPTNPENPYVELIEDIADHDVFMSEKIKSILQSERVKFRKVKKEVGIPTSLPVMFYQMNGSVRVHSRLYITDDQGKTTKVDLSDYTDTIESNDPFFVSIMIHLPPTIKQVVHHVAGAFVQPRVDSRMTSIGVATTLYVQ